jgi:hypothetical protein
MSTTNSDSYFHLARFTAFDGGDLYVPLTSIAAIYKDNADEWHLATVDGGVYDILDEVGDGIHSITKDLVTWQVRQNTDGPPQGLLDAVQALREANKAEAARDGSVAS